MSGPALAPARRAWLRCLLRGDREAALRVAFQALADGHPPHSLYVEVLQEALYQLGHLAEDGEVSPAESGMAVAAASYVLARLVPRLEGAETRRARGRVVVTGVKGERHLLGGLMVADLLEADGWSVRYLGSDSPAAAVVDLLRRQKADVLAVSCSMHYNVARVAELVEGVRAAFGGGLPRVLVGGLAFRHSPRLARRVGADAFAADAAEAIALARVWSSTGLW